MPKTLVFGGSGFFGPSLLARYPDLISIGRTPPPLEVKNRHISLAGLDDLHVLDTLDFDSIIFLIGNSNHHEINQQCLMGFEYNVLPLKKILYYLKTSDRKLKKFIAFSGALLYDTAKIILPVGENQPLNPFVNEYIFSKYVAEQIAQFYAPAIPVITVRLSNIYGPTRLQRPDLIPTLMHGVLSSQETTVWNTTPERDFVYVNDVADAVMKLIPTDHTGPVNIGSGTKSSIGEVVRIIEKLSGKKIRVLHAPVTGPMQYQHDISLIKQLTGWQPSYTLEQGLQETYEIMKSYL